MQRQDPEFIQILNIIRRGQRLVIQSKKDGVDTSLAEELINEARYALKIGKREEAIDYAKKSIMQVIRSKREIDKIILSEEGALEKLTKEELRHKCKEMQIESLGLKSELVERIRTKLQEKDIPSEQEEVTRTIEDDIPQDEEVKIKEAPAVEDQAEVEVIKLPEEKTVTPDPVQASTNNVWDAAKTAKELIPGLSYVIEEKRPEKLFHIYKALLDLDMTGLIVSRTNPKILTRSYGLGDGGSVWLTGKEVKGEMTTVLPILEFMMSLYEDYIEKNDHGIILLDGLEYLLTNNKFNSVLRFIRQLVDNISQTECILMVALSPDALDSTEVTLLEKDLLPLNYIE